MTDRKRKKGRGGKSKRGKVRVLPSPIQDEHPEKTESVGRPSNPDEVKQWGDVLPFFPTEQPAQIRARIANGKVFVVKIGSAVASDRPALVRIAKQVAAAVEAGKKIVLVLSGAIAVEESMLPEGSAATGPASGPRAGAGQSAVAGLINSYVPTALFLISAGSLPENLSERIRSYLPTVVPVVNENDVVREESDPIDNDWLAGKIARELGSHALIFMTNVDGVFSKYPSDDPADRVSLIRAWEKQPFVVSDERSAVGTGGMESKLASAVATARHGIPCVIASGLTPDTLREVLAGHPVGTLIAD